MKTFVFISGSRTGHNFIMNMVRSWVAIDIDPEPPKFINYENVKAEDYRRTLSKWIEAGQIDCGKSTVYPILIVRDLLNWWASYLKYVPDVAQRNHQNLFDVWVSHVREVFGETKYISHKAIIEYDKFNYLQSYREKLCNHTGGVYHEAQIDVVPLAGRGSSFDGQAIPGSMLETDLRYQYYQNHEYYLSMLWENPAAVELYMEHFTLTPHQKQIIKAL